MVPVRHRTATVEGQRVFFREAGPRDAPAVVLLHGFPTSSHMFRHLISALADRYQVIATDHIGFGYSSAPSLEDFPYTFEALTDVTAGLLANLGLDRYTLYVHDYGAAIGGAWQSASPIRSARSSRRMATPTQRASLRPSGADSSPTRTRPVPTPSRQYAAP